MERLGGEIRRELSRFGPQGGMADLVSAWPDAVGPMVAANAWPARFARDGTLHVNTSSASWALELSQLVAEIAERLREKLGKSAPTSLRFSVGHLPEAEAPDTSGRRTEAPEPSEDELKRAAELAADIDDDELRERVARVIALGLSRPPSDRPF